MRQTKFTELTLKDLAALAYKDDEGLEVTRIVISGIEMPSAGTVRHAMKDRWDVKHGDQSKPLYYYSDRPANLKWLVDAGCVLYPYAGQPIKVIL